MARYTGPRTKVARKFGEPIFGPDKVLERKNYPSGEHGLSKKRKKVSEYGIQLKEKQKAKAIYGILEKQFRRTFEEAARRNGITGENLLVMLESRLDNTVYRLGLAPTRAAARQLVSHRHITVNGKVLNIPSYQVKVGESIAVREKSKSMEIITDSIGKNNTSKYSWLEWNTEIMGGSLIQKPERSEIPESINEQLIVELYSK